MPASINELKKQKKPASPLISPPSLSMSPPSPSHVHRRSLPESHIRRRRSPDPLHRCRIRRSRAPYPRAAAAVHRIRRRREGGRTRGADLPRRRRSAPPLPGDVHAGGEPLQGPRELRREGPRVLHHRALLQGPCERGCHREGGRGAPLLRRERVEGGPEGERVEEGEIDGA